MSIGTLILRFVQASILVLIAAPVLWLCFTGLEPEVILFQASRIADSRPYCIVVADKDHSERYKQVTKRSDLTFNALAVHTYGGFAGEYYSLLILGYPDEMRNWSKFYLNFRSDVVETQSSIYRKTPRSLCTPVTGFAKSVSY
jgi:hypothetical protein